jgi:hypothetical protein
MNENNFKVAGALVGLVILWTLVYIFLAPAKAHAQGIIGINVDGTAILAPTGSNSIYIDQIGSYNSTTVVQDGSGHSVSIVTGKTGAVDNNYVNITQQGTGAKSISIENPSGYNNSITTLQDGAGNHTAAIQNLNGAGNGFNISQTGAGTHSFTATGGQGTTNNGLTVTATQSGGVGAEKTFNLWLNGSNNATVQIEQTNPNASGQAGMNISCGNSCGTTPWSYISR